MKAHNGMRPQDIVILLKIICLQDRSWQYRDLSAELFIPISEISASLYRSHLAGLINEDKHIVHRQSFMEFLQYGLRYVFPQVPGSMAGGLPTAHSHPFFKTHFPSDLDYVWPDIEEGTARGLAIDPLHKGVPKAARKDELLYKMLAGVDILRVGRVREIKMALEELKQVIL